MLCLTPTAAGSQLPWIGGLLGKPVVTEDLELRVGEKLRQEAVEDFLVEGARGFGQVDRRRWMGV